jgi:hypothetical protein
MQVTGGRRIGGEFLLHEEGDQAAPLGSRFDEPQGLLALQCQGVDRIGKYDAVEQGKEWHNNSVSIMGCTGSAGLCALLSG